MEKPTVVYIERERKPNHILHLLLTILSFGLWAPIWFLVAFAHGLKRSKNNVKSAGASFMAGIREGMKPPSAR